MQGSATRIAHDPEDHTSPQIAEENPDADDRAVEPIVGRDQPAAGERDDGVHLKGGKIAAVPKANNAADASSALSAIAVPIFWEVRTNINGRKAAASTATPITTLRLDPLVGQTRSVASALRLR